MEAAAYSRPECLEDDSSCDVDDLDFERMPESGDVIDSGFPEKEGPFWFCIFLMVFFPFGFGFGFASKIHMIFFFRGGIERRNEYEKQTSFQVAKRL